MNLLDEMQAYVALTDDELVQLHSFWPALEPHAADIVDHFYERLMSFEGTRRVLKSEAQVQRLRKSLHRWFEDTICSPRDAAYFERRKRVGQVHVDVGLEPRYMLGAMAVVIADLHRIVVTSFGMPSAGDVCDIVTRAMMLDVSLMTSSYVTSRDRHQMHALQSVLVARLAIPVLLVDDEGEVVACTPPAVALAGGVDPLGRHWTDSLPAGLVRNADLERVVADSIATATAQTLRRVDAERRSFRLHVVPLAHAFATVMLQIEELTEALELEARVHQAESLAQLGTLSAAVAHELRNPLAGIRGAIQVMASSLPEDAPHRPIMAKVEQEVDRLNGLVTDLLTYARPRPPRADPIDLRAITHRIVPMAAGPEPRIEGDGMAIGDADQVQQILLNLLQNAAQAGATDIRVSIEDGRLWVADDGPGIPDEELERIFEPFVTTKTRGTGLGLAISRRAASQMGGWLDLVSSDASLGGATLLLTLPVDA